MKQFSPIALLLVLVSSSACRDVSLLQAGPSKTNSTILPVTLPNAPAPQSGPALSSAPIPAQPSSSNGGISSLSQPGISSTLIPAQLDSVNVKSYGAIGDGRTDDTAAIQRAINYANQVMLQLYFPPGTYAVVPGALPEIHVSIHAAEAFVQAINSVDGPLLTVNYVNPRPNNTTGAPYAYQVQVGGIIGYFSGAFNSTGLPAPLTGTGLWVKSANAILFDIHQTQWLKIGVHVDASWKTGAPMPSIGGNTFWIKADACNVGLQISTNNDPFGVPIDVNRFFLGSSFNHASSLINIDAGTTTGSSDVHNNVFEMDLLEIPQPNSDGIVLRGLANYNEFKIHNLRGVNGSGAYARVDGTAINNTWDIPVFDPNKWAIGSTPQVILAQTRYATPNNIFQFGDPTNLFGIETRSDGAGIGGVGAGNLARVGGWYKSNPIPGASIQFQAQGSSG